MKKEDYTGNNLMKARENKGYTQNKLCDLCGIKWETYRKYENGTNPPSIKNLYTLSKVLDVSTDYLLEVNDCTSVDNHYISVNTGLSDKAITKLKESISHLNHSFHGLDVINFLCENYDGNEGTYKLLASIYGYFSLEYSIPVYHDGTSITTPKNTNDKTKANRLSLAASFNYDLNDDTPMLTLAMPDNFHDYIKFRMDKDFLASVHMNNIREQLIKLSDNYTVAES